MTVKQTRGAKLVSSIRAEMESLNCVPTSTEEELLRLAVTLADRLEQLEKIIERDGLMITTSRGDLRTHPAAAEHRAVTTNLARVLSSVYVGDSVTTPRPNPAKARAAKHRWDRRQAERGVG